MSTPAQGAQPDWFDANGTPIPAQSQTQPQTSGDWFADNAPAQGDVKNDVGNTVITPKSGESFADTMNRAAQYGRTVTPQQIQAEMRTAPGKVATVLTAAPAAGFLGAAGISAADTGIYQAAKGLGYSAEAIKDGLSTPMGRYILKEAVKAGVGGGGFGIVYGLMKKAGIFGK